MADLRGELFKTLEFKESRQRSLWMSVAVHSALLCVLLMAPLVFTNRIEVIRFNTVPLAPRPERREILEITHYKPPKPPPAEPVLAEPPEPTLPEPEKVAKVMPHELVESPKAPLVIPSVHTLDTANATSAVPLATPAMAVRTGVFSSQSPATPATNLSVAQVQTGGFGDPNGIQGDGKPDRVSNIVSLGSFGLPAGPGAGNGSGGPHGARTTVATTEFGSGVAPVGNRGAGSGSQGPPRSVHRAGFEDVDAAKPDAPKVRSDAGPPQTPAEIISKPRPDYTEEARRLKVEGEVLVRVLFTAYGEVRVLNVVRGLGHGLDESALRAVEHIKFKPAQRDGQPADSTATVHIVFQLAY
jgi:TonB family protein